MDPAGCTLKTLAPVEKAKVVQLMRRIVEQQHQLEALEQDRAQERQQLEQALSMQRELQEQNTHVARDNSSLRAKLTHAFSLLKTYQHKVRVLHAALQAGPPAPGGASSSSSGPALLGAAGCADAQLQEAGWRAPVESPVSSGSWSTAGLSPIREASPEGALHSSSSSSVAGTSSASAASASAAEASSVQPASATMQVQSQGQVPHSLPEQPQLCSSSLQPPAAAPLPPLQQQLEPLTLLARALLEAQAEMLFASRQQTVSSSSLGSCQAGAGGAALTVVAPAAPPIACSSKENVPANSCGALPPSATPQLAESEQAVCGNSCTPGCLPSPSGAGCGSTNHLALPSSAAAGRATPAEPTCLAQRQYYTSSSGAEEQRQCGSAAVLQHFDPSLLDLVEELEGFMPPAASLRGARQDQRHTTAGLSCPSQPRLPRPGELSSQKAVKCWSELYEESDLLSIIEALG